MTTTSSLSAAERFQFDNDGYLVLENFLKPDHVEALLQATYRAVARRRALKSEGIAHTGQSWLGERNARLFYILDDDPLFLEMLNWPPIMPYITGLLNEKPHHHASDVIVEYPEVGRGMGWHIDGHDNGYRGLGHPIPLLQLKIGYYLTDMTEPGRGHLCVVPGSHKAQFSPDPTDLKRTELFPGAIQVCAPAGSAVLFHNALWHSGGPWTRDDGARIMLYYAYEHPWMMASAEHWNYRPEFYNGLSPERRKLFHGFVFDPPEQRWG
jgi:ectoine hydroxylase-related dioxygenase (phytanoyl-CoA dioxygenase family)